MITFERYVEIKEVELKTVKTLPEYETVQKLFKDFIDNFDTQPQKAIISKLMLDDLLAYAKNLPPDYYTGKRQGAKGNAFGV